MPLLLIFPLLELVSWPTTRKWSAVNKCLEEEKTGNVWSIALMTIMLSTITLMTIMLSTVTSMTVTLSCEISMMFCCLYSSSYLCSPPATRRGEPNHFSRICASAKQCKKSVKGCELEPGVQYCKCIPNELSTGWGWVLDGKLNWLKPMWNQTLGKGTWSIRRGFLTRSLGRCL